METSKSAQVRPSVGVPRESSDGERRVALVPKIVSALIGKGVDVVVESGAGLGALIPDELYTAAGAKIGDPWTADVVVKVAPPSTEEIARISTGAKLIGFLNPRNADNRIAELKAAGIRGIRRGGDSSYLSRAGDGTALSSQANVSGYKAVLLAASESTRFFPMLTTAAGHGEALRRFWSSEWVWQVCRRWRQPSVSVAALPGTTCVLRSPTRCVRWVHSGARLGNRCGGRGWIRPRVDRRRASEAAAGTRRCDQGLRRCDHHSSGSGSSPRRAW